MKTKILGAVTAFVYFAAVSPGFSVEYSIIDLGTLPGAPDSYGFGINNSGQVTGSSYVNNIATATVWNGTTPTPLGMLPGATTSSAQGINNQGQVVGASGLPNNNYVATVWNGTTPTALGFLPGTNYSVGLAINASGRVAGYSNINNVTGSLKPVVSCRSTTLLAVIRDPKAADRDEEWLSVALIIQRKNRETSYPTSPVSRAIRKAGRKVHATS